MMGKRYIRIACVTPRGRELAERLMANWTEYIPLWRRREESPEEWAAEGFRMHQPLLFVGAAGIAIRTVAPLVKDKLQDSPVLVMDEGGRHIIPLLSGHMGGANALARDIGARIGADPAITTATDVNGCFAIDDFARRSFPGGCRRTWCFGNGATGRPKIPASRMGLSAFRRRRRRKNV